MVQARLRVLPDASQRAKTISASITYRFTNRGDAAKACEARYDVDEASKSQPGFVAEVPQLVDSMSRGSKGDVVLADEW